MIKKYAIFIPAICMMIIIFSFSSQDSNESGELSGSITKKVVNIIMNLVDDKIPKEDVIKYSDTLETIIRKCAHGTEYFILSITYCLVFFNLKNTRQRFLHISFLSSFLYAMTDELHQYFIPGRACLLTDVLIDSFGALIGVVFIGIIISLRTKYIMSTHYYT